MAKPPSPALPRVLRLIDCMAADHHLGGMILFDLDPSLLLELGYVLAERLGHDTASEGASGGVVVVGAGTTADDLWLQTLPEPTGFALRPGLLVEDDNGSPPPVVVVPDLERASLPVIQAAVTCLNADTASVERLGHSIRWQPRARWLTSLRRRAAGHLSPHLLDRFPLRVHASGVREELLSLRNEAAASENDRSLLHAAASSCVARRTDASLSPEAAQLVVSLMPSNPSRRRDLALARTARALSGAAAEISARHVRDAADLLGITALAKNDRSSAGTPTPGTSPTGGEVGDEAGPPGSHQVSDPGPAHPLPGEDMSTSLASSLPYPEDDPEAIAPFASLRSVYQPAPGTQATHRHEAGVRPARTAGALAVVATLLEAAKFQTVRHITDSSPSSRRFIVHATDLREYRSSNRSNWVLVLVVDHSSQATQVGAPALAPFLRWAHQQNAAVSVIEFGHQDAADELVAEHYCATSVLDPRVPGSLARSPGLASPLAHALDLAVSDLRRYRRNRGGVHEAVLVVMTDGRGNVPLAASLLGKVPEGVSRQGVSDALAAAATVRRLARVRPVVIAPQTQIYPELAADLADVMGGQLITAAARTNHPRTVPNQ